MLLRLVLLLACGLLPYTPLDAQEVCWDVRFKGSDALGDAQWSADGSRVLYRLASPTDQEFVETLGNLSAEGKDPKPGPKLDADGASLRLLPGGHEALVARFPRDSVDGAVLAMELDTGKSRALFETGLHQAWDAAPSPDGTKVAFVQSDRTSWALVVCRVDGSERKEVLPNAERWVSCPTWSPDGARIACSIEEADGRCRIHVCDLDSGQDTAITPSSLSAGGCAWSPDGCWIACHAKQEAMLQVYLASPDGKRLLRLTDGVRGWYTLAWSPDGQSLVGCTTDADSTSAIACLSVPREPVGLDAPREGRVEGECVYVTEAPIAGRSKAGTASAFRLLRCSPDGRIREVVADSAACPTPLPAGGGVLYLILPPEGGGGELRLLKDGETRVIHAWKGYGKRIAWAFSPDGSSLAIVSTEGLFFGDAPAYSMEQIVGLDDAERLARLGRASVRWVPERREVLLGPPAEGGSAVLLDVANLRSTPVAGAWSQLWPLPGGGFVGLRADPGATGTSLIRLEGQGAETPIAEFPGGACILLGVSAGGERAYVSHVTPPSADGIAHDTGTVVECDLVGKGLRTLTHALAIGGALSPDGKRLLLVEAVMHLKEGDGCPGAMVVHDIESGRDQVVLQDCETGALTFLSMFAGGAPLVSWGK